MAIVVIVIYYQNPRQSGIRIRPITVEPRYNGQFRLSGLTKSLSGYFLCRESHVLIFHRPLYRDTRYLRTVYRGLNLLQVDLLASGASLVWLKSDEGLLESLIAGLSPEYLTSKNLINRNGK